MNERAKLPSTLKVCAAFLGLAGLAAQANAVVFWVIPTDIDIVVMKSSVTDAAALSVFMLTDPRPGKDWVPPDEENLIRVVEVALSAVPPERLVNELRACLKMAQIVQFRPSTFSMSLRIWGLEEADLLWIPESKKVKVSVPDGATIGCDTRK